MSKTIRFSGMLLDLPDGWFEIKTRGVGIQSFLKFADATRVAVEPIDLADPPCPRETFTTLRFQFAPGIKPRHFRRRIASYRENVHDEATQISPEELRQHGGRLWTCWEVVFPPGRYAPVEFLSCDAYALVGKPEDPEHVLWGVSAMGSSALAEVIRESFSFALSKLIFE
jgi:hypothetical protein